MSAGCKPRAIPFCYIGVRKSVPMQTTAFNCYRDNQMGCDIHTERLAQPGRVKPEHFKSKSRCFQCESSGIFVFLENALRHTSNPL